MLAVIDAAFGTSAGKQERKNLRQFAGAGLTFVGGNRTVHGGEERMRFIEHQIHTVSAQAGFVEAGVGARSVREREPEATDTGR